MRIFPLLLNCSILVTISNMSSNVGVGGVLYQADEYGGDITPHNKYF